MTTNNYLIIGQGIAGSILAYQLLQQGKKVIVVNEAHAQTSSRVAAGIINPVTGRRIVKSWKIDTLLPQALEFYRHIERRFGIKILVQKNILRIFENQREQNDFLAKTAEPAYLHYIQEFNETIPEVKAELGIGEIQQAYYVLTVPLLDRLRAYFKEQNAFLPSKFDHEALKIHEKSVEWNDIKAERIVFCEGAKMLQNPYFNYLPMQPTKGEFLIIKAKLPTQYVLKKSITIVPYKTKNTFWVGATFNREDIDHKTTKEARNYLKEKLKNTLQVDFEILEQGTGIRPTIKDRRPLIGTHPHHPQLCVFNGMGSKGISLTPYCTNQFINHLEKETILEPEIDITRHQNKYF